MSRYLTKFIVAVTLAGAIYFLAAVYLVNYTFGVAPGLGWLQGTFGQLAGTRIWAYSVHALGLVVAALPAALLLHLVLGLSAVRSAFWAGSAAAIGALVPTFLNPEIRERLAGADFMIMGVDSLTMVAILVLLTWLLSKLPSNYALERSMTGSSERAAGAQKIIAPTARRPRLARPAQRRR